jgi:folate-dependent phosphoribosylglycinamide formyltransferase PurN
MGKPRLIVFASGTPTGGGSGFEELVASSRKGILDADIAAVVSNCKNGGVREKAKRLKIPFVYFRAPYTEERYLRIVHTFPHDFIALSGWLKLVVGLEPRITFNIHPGPLPDFGGPGMYGHHVHQAVLKAYHEGKITHSAVSMHFVTPEYDKGPIFFRVPVPIEDNDSVDALAGRVNGAEHVWQPLITNLVVQGDISWDGENPGSMRLPAGYSWLR